MCERPPAGFASFIARGFFLERAPAGGSFGFVERVGGAASGETPRTQVATLVPTYILWGGCCAAAQPSSGVLCGCDGLLCRRAFLRGRLSPLPTPPTPFLPLLRVLPGVPPSVPRACGPFAELQGRPPEGAQHAFAGLPRPGARRAECLPAGFASSTGSGFVWGDPPGPAPDLV